MQLLLVNGVDFTDLIFKDNYNFITEDGHAEGSGRNPLDFLMEFVIIGSKHRVELQFPENHRMNARFRQFASAVSANGRINSYTAYNTYTGGMVSFTGYINKREARLIQLYASGAWIRPAQINIIEM